MSRKAIVDPAATLLSITTAWPVSAATAVATTVAANAYCCYFFCHYSCYSLLHTVYLYYTSDGPAKVAAATPVQKSPNMNQMADDNTC